MRLKFLCIYLGLLTSPTLSSAAQMTRTPDCKEVAVPVQMSRVSSWETYRAAGIEAGRATRIRFHKINPLVGRRIVSIDPLVSEALLDNGAGIQFVRDVNGDGHVVGVKTVRSAKCWLDSGNFAYPKKARGPNYELIVNDYPPGAPRETMRLENRGGHGMISRIVSFPDKLAGKHTEVLIVTKKPIEAFGITVMSIEGGQRTLAVVMRDTDGSLIDVGYAYTDRRARKPN